MALTYIDLVCKSCKTSFKSEKSYYNHRLKKGKFVQYCSTRCNHDLRIKKRIQKQCKFCKKKFKIREAQIKDFCSQSCSATFNNLNKSYGTKVSKLEIWLQTKLQSLYPSIKFLFNYKEAINSELDIYIAELNLAFELNGIYHYEPIHGKKLLNKIKNNDHRKFQACLENNIELCIIDTSSQKVFKEKTSEKFLFIIKNIIDKKVGDPVGFEPTS